MILNSPGGLERLRKKKPIANLLKVLISAFVQLNMGRQVAVDKAETRLVEVKANCHASFVSLKKYKIYYKIRSSLD